MNKVEPGQVWRHKKHRDIYCIVVPNQYYDYMCQFYTIWNNNIRHSFNIQNTYYSGRSYTYADLAFEFSLTSFKSKKDIQDYLLAKQL